MVNRWNLKGVGIVSGWWVSVFQPGGGVEPLRTTGGEGVASGGGGRWWWGMVVVVVGVLTMVVVVVGGRKGFPQEVLGSHVTASDLERLMSEGPSMGTCFNNAGALVI